MANVAFIQNRLGRTDGVSLEVDKWRDVLQNRMGHTVHYASGNPEVKTNYIIDEIYGPHPVTWKILQNATVQLKDYPREEDLELEIYNHADRIAQKVIRFIEEKKVQLLLPNNLCSVGYQPASGIALHRVFQQTGIAGIVHSHDFYFEDSGEVNPTCHVAESIFHRYFPPKLPNVQHVVINRLAQAQLKQRKNISATVVPNVFDFNQPKWIADAYNSDFRSAFNINKNDLVFLQATRILDRKSIELAIDTLAEIERVPALRNALVGAPTAAGGKFAASDKIVLLCAGIIETMGISGNYWGSLVQKAKSLGFDMRHVGDRVTHSRGTTPTGQKAYSLWDAYVLADFVTYPSTWEGWGNQFIEAVFAKLPVLIFEYPVWTSDLGPAGFDVVSLGSELTTKFGTGLVTVAPQKISAAAQQIVHVLTNPKRRAAMVEKNFDVGKQNFSLDALQRIITPLLQRAGL